MASNYTEQGKRPNASDSTSVAVACREAGVDIASIWDLVNSGRDYSRAIPALLDILPQIKDRKVKEGVVRALAVPEARGLAAKILLAEMRANLVDEMLVWAIGNTLSVVVTPEDGVFEDLAVLLRDDRLGMGRQMLADALVRTRDPRATGILLEVLPQKEISGHVLHALGELRSPEAIPSVTECLHSKNAFVRREAQKALEKIGGSSVRN